MSQPQDLNALATNALRDIKQAEQRRSALTHKSSRNFSWFNAASTVLLAGIFVLAAGGSDSRRFWLGVTDQEQTSEMSAALTTARLAVDSSHATTGQWPDRVPLPALAALVDLQNPGPNYRLMAQTDRWRLTMTTSGDIQKIPL